MNTPHKHANLIKKWADGAVIQYSENGKYWSDCDRTPTWASQYYRVKPEITTSLSNDELYGIYHEAPRHVEGGSALVQGLRVVADAAIKQYIKENTK